MADNIPVTLVDPFRVASPGEAGPFPFEMFAARALAQGDSWFSIGAIPPGATSNLLAELVLSRSMVAVNCARPGKELAHMTERLTEPMFLRLLRGPLALSFDVLLLSGGGNDLIDAATVGPAAARDRRLLLRPDEREADPAGGAAYLSDEGWATFASHLEEVWQLFLAERAAGVNAQTPVVLHNYAPIMPRPAPAGPRFGPWLQPALVAFGVPSEAWLSVTAELLDRLDALLRRLIAAQQAAMPGDRLALVDSQQASLVLAVETATGVSGDWQNEIHPTRAGYRKAAAAWRAVLDPLLGG